MVKARIRLTDINSRVVASACGATVVTAR